MKLHTFPKIMAFLSIILCLTPAAFAITINDLLSNTTKTITYGSNLAFTDNGTMVDLVNDPNFRKDDDADYYAVAYKITLQEGDHIEIHSSKEGDSYLYLYKADGADGYIEIDFNDDGYGRDSYLNFIASTAGDYFIVITDYDPNVAGTYYLTVWNTDEEPGISLYTQIDYTPLSFSGSSASANGILNTKVKVRQERDYDYFNVFNASGYSFNAIADKTYKITVRYTQSESSKINARFYILKDDLQGNLEDDIISSSDDWEDNATELILTNFYKSSTGGYAKILLGDYYGNDLNYTVTVEEVANLTFYIDFSYSSQIPTNGTPVNGTSTNYIGFNYQLTGKDHNFDAEANSTYKITCTFNSTQIFYDDVFGIFLLKSGALQGTESDIIYRFEVDNSSQGTKQGTLIGYFKATTTEQLKVLLYDFNQNDYNYTISIEKLPPPITLAQLLNNTTKIISYSNDLEFADRGTTVDLVNDPDFREGNENYFAVAYKITLQEGNHIEIHSSKEGDSYLYLYKADGTEYIYIYHDDDSYDDDGRDSYLNFIASTAGDYYIVVTDYASDRDGRYYLTVWNTDEEPTNEYDPVPIIAKAPKANTNALKASVQNGTLHLSGLATGKTWSIYTVSGTLVYKGVANGAEANLHLNASGVYLVKSNGQVVRVINR